MKTLLISLLVFGSSIAFAQDSGLKCTMSYSSTDALESGADSNTQWLVAGGQMKGSAVGVDNKGLWTKKPANIIKVDKKGALWQVNIFNDKNALMGSFSFTEKAGMKATLATEAYMANESEDPPKYNKLEVSCYYTYFAG